MKKFLGVISFLVLIGCDSSSKNEKELLEKENQRLQRELELIKHEQNLNSEVEESNSKSNAYTFDNFHISEDRVGIFSKGMTMADVYKAIPKEQIKKKVGYGEFADDTYDDYEIYDSNGDLLLILTPKENGNINSKINRISILDKRFKTTENIGLDSTFGDLKKYYSTNDIAPDMEHIVVFVEHINAWFSIKKTELKDDWWNGKSIDKSKIPNSAKFDAVTVWFE